MEIIVGSHKFNPHSPYIEFSRKEWGELRSDTPLTLTEEELGRLRGVNEKISLAEVEDIYLPLSRLLNLYVAAVQKLYSASASFLGNSTAKVPYIIGLAGSVAVGKSTTSRILQALLSRWPDHPKVEWITTDGFLLPNKELEKRGLMGKKGFPESYDLPRMVQFVSDVKGGRQDIEIPIYSHHNYDILPDQYHLIQQPDIMIVEGLNVLQTGSNTSNYKPLVYISDFFDFTIYVHSETDIIRQWYLDRFLTFSDNAKNESTSFYHQFSHQTREEVLAYASHIWQEINEVNLVENILPTRMRTKLILNKSSDHSIRTVLLRKL